MTVEQHTLVNPTATAQPKPTSKFHEVLQQISELTTQVAALTTCQTSYRTTSIQPEQTTAMFYMQ